MKIHEYQAKELFKKYLVPVPKGQAVFSVDEAVDTAEKLGSFPVVVKAQIHAGGRGKGGGVKLAKSLDEVKNLANEILGMTLVTHQTGPEGKLVQKLLIETGQDIKKELYLSLLVDRATASIVIMASQDGGMDIEAVAANTPERIIKVYINPLTGLTKDKIQEVALGLELSETSIKDFSVMLPNLYRCFMENDCSLVEINPLILTNQDKIIALDAKVDIDGNSLFRHPDLLELRDITEEDPLEVEASTFHLNYINLSGNVGNIVNGAGLAMATMDMIKNVGASPANFMDVGGGASAEQVENAFRIILSDEKVQAVLINIFGGILRCDSFAQGIVDAAKKVGVSIPVVVRMEGTNVNEGKRILTESDLNLINASDLSDAAEKIAKAVKP